MPTYVVTAPDGKEYEVNAPDGKTKEEALSYFQQNWKPPEPTITPRKTPQRWSDVAIEAVGNLPKSALHFAEGAVNTVMHPIDTATAIKDVAVGGAANLLPESIAPDATVDQRNAATHVADFYKDRYGSMDGFKRAFAEDPLGVASDVSALVTGGGALASKIPGFAKTAEAINAAGGALNPVSLTLKAAGKTGGTIGNRVADVVGMTTGAGSTAIKKAYEAGKVGGDKAEAFVRNLRGDADIADVVGDAKGALANMRKARGARYREGMEGIKADQSVLSYEPIVNATLDALDVSNFHGKSINRSAAGVQQKIGELIDEWGRSDPNVFHTAEGFDALKQTIGDIRDSTEARTPSRVVADRVYNAVKNQIVEQAPDYANVMKDYEQASRLTNEIERALSLGEKASADTAVRKLQSLTRNNVSTNYGNRMKLADELEQSGSPNLMTKLSGQALNSWTPRGFQGATGGGATIYGLTTGNPSVIAALPITSPRLMGESAFLAGKTSRGYDAMKPLLDKIDRRDLANYLYQMNQPKEVNGGI